MVYWFPGYSAFIYRVDNIIAIEGFKHILSHECSGCLMINAGIMINNFKIGLHPYYIATPLNNSRVLCYVCVTSWYRVQENEFTINKNAAIATIVSIISRSQFQSRSP